MQLLFIVVSITKRPRQSIKPHISFTVPAPRSTVSLPVMLNAIEFRLNGRTVRVEDVSPNTSLMETVQGTGLTGASASAASDASVTSRCPDLYKVAAHAT